MWSGALGHVAMEHLQGAASLADHIGVPLEDLLLPCVFCGVFLTYSDLVAFDFKKLQLTWKKGYPHASCSACARKVAERERELFTERILTGVQFAEQFGGGLTTVFCRCFGCLKLLTVTELVLAITRGDSFFLVRGRWRGRCRTCQ
ncbi:unnamed protein product [Canis familiaris papillomavirus 10]|uniref:Protein E6 n=1 Tax=Canis familiaris papillomavirus 10 TaxID=1087109 RepID=G4XF69_9PAPI|nr:unnamed protein product [Canis familiaris papillomavirus 10]AEP82741.1 E6 [Canis familiaris papillomavirus 10]